MKNSQCENRHLLMSRSNFEGGFGIKTTFSFSQNAVCPPFEIQMLGLFRQIKRNVAPRRWKIYTHILRGFFFLRWILWGPHTPAPLNPIHSGRLASYIEDECLGENLFFVFSPLSSCRNNILNELIESPTLLTFRSWGVFKIGIFWTFPFVVTFLNLWV